MPGHVPQGLRGVPTLATPPSNESSGNGSEIEGTIRVNTYNKKTNGQHSPGKEALRWFILRFAGQHWPPEIAGKRKQHQNHYKTLVPPQKTSKVLFLRDPGALVLFLTMVSVSGSSMVSLPHLRVFSGSKGFSHINTSFVLEEESI